MFLNVICGIVGRYATFAAIETATAPRHDQHSTELAVLCHASIVTSFETEERCAWAECRINSGRRAEHGRGMAQDEFSSKRESKPLVDCNRKMVLGTSMSTGAENH